MINKPHIVVSYYPGYHWRMAMKITNTGIPWRRKHNHYSHNRIALKTLKAPSNHSRNYTPGQDMLSTIVVQPLSRKHLAKTYL